MAVDPRNKVIVTQDVVRVVTVGIQGPPGAGLSFNDVQGEPAEVGVGGEQPGTSLFAARRDHKHELDVAELDAHVAGLPVSSATTAAVQAEATQRQAGDTALATQLQTTSAAVTSESARAEAAESANATAIMSEASTRAAADTANASATAAKADKTYVDAQDQAETARAEAAEQANATAVAGKYSKPSGGIPETDLAGALSSKIDAASTTAATAYQKPGTGIPKADLATGVQASLGSAESAVQTVNGHAGSAVTVGKADVGLGNVPNVDATQRANHLGTQISSTISDFAGSVDARISLAISGLVKAVAARDYGAKGDGKIVADGVMTIGSAILTSSTASFVPTDPGKAVIVLGAGTDTGGGNVLNTTIQTYISSTQVTLAAAATNTVSAARTVFGTDDTSKLQLALNAASGKGWVTLDPLIYVTPNASLNIGPLSGLIGSGQDSTMLVGGGVNALSDTSIVADLTIDSANNYYYTTLYSRGIGKVFTRLKLRNWGRYGIDLANDATRGQGSKDCYVTFCDFKHNGLNATNGGEVEVEGNYQNIHIADSTFGSSTNGGCFMEVTVSNGVDDPGLHTSVNRELYVERNSVLGPFAKSGYVVGRHVRVRDNDFYTDFQVSSGGKEGSSPNSTWITEDVEVSGNTFNTNSFTGNETLLSLFTGQSTGDSGVLQNVTVERNTFVNGNIITQLLLDSNLNDIKIRNNQFVDTHKNGIWCFANGFNLILNNYVVEGNTYKNWASTSGTWAAIAFTASGTGKTITFGRVRVSRNIFGPGRANAGKGLYVQSISGGGAAGTLSYDSNDFGTTSVTSDVSGILFDGGASNKVSKAGGDAITVVAGSTYDGLDILQNDTSTSNNVGMRVTQNGPGGAVVGIATAARNNGQYFGSAGYFKSQGAADGTTLNAVRTVPASNANGNPAGALAVSSSAAEVVVPLADFNQSSSSSTQPTATFENAGSGGVVVSTATGARSSTAYYGSAGYFASAGSANGTTLNATRSVAATSSFANPAAGLAVSSSALETAVPLADFKLANAASTVDAITIENAGSGNALKTTSPISTGPVTAPLFSGSGANLSSIPESAVVGLNADLASKSSKNFAIAMAVALG